jgi:hypothetical protein
MCFLGWTFGPVLLCAMVPSAPRPLKLFKPPTATPSTSRAKRLLEMAFDMGMKVLLKGRCGDEKYPKVRPLLRPVFWPAGLRF